MEKFLFFTLVLATVLSTSSCISTQYMATNTSKDGKCFVKCAISPSDQIITIDHVYNGSDPSDESNIEKKTIVIQEPYQEWVKRKADVNCLSDNPEDCLVWCKIDQPGIYETVYIVTDTTATTAYESKEFHLKPAPEAEPTTSWEECVCGTDVTPQLISDIQLQLKSKGYYDGDINGLLTPQVKQATLDYQKEHRLPYGGLTIKYLEHLGVSY